MPKYIVIVLSLLATSECCTLLRTGPLTCRDVKRLLEYHNTLRNNVALHLTKLPPAKEMWALKWNEPMAEIAQEFAQSCVTGDHPNRPNNAGQNIALMASHLNVMGDVIQMAEAWTDQMSKYSWDRKFDLSNSSVGDFTQMIWAKTQYLGCGLSHFKNKLTEEKLSFRTYLVCFYYPAGNGDNDKVAPYQEYEPGNHRCENKRIHVRFKGLCGTGPLTCRDVKRLLEYHNTLRNKVALHLTKLPPAKEMWALKWNEPMAKLAQDYTEKCAIGYDKNRPEKAGQNYALMGSSSKMMGDVIKLAESWLNQREKYSWEKKFELSNDSVGHFTQMIWGETKYLGCGMSFFKENSNEQYNYETYLVCFYYPAGNSANDKKPPYEVLPENGARCENKKVHVRFKGLCAQDYAQEHDKYLPCKGGSERQIKHLSFPTYIGIYCIMVYFQAIF